MTELLKADHPRAIDRYIDFFGDGAATSSDALDPRTLPDERRMTEPAPRRSS